MNKWNRPNRSGSQGGFENTSRLAQPHNYSPSEPRGARQNNNKYGHAHPKSTRTGACPPEGKAMTSLKIHPSVPSPSAVRRVSIVHCMYNKKSVQKIGWCPLHLPELLLRETNNIVVSPSAGKYGHTAGSNFRVVQNSTVCCSMRASTDSQYTNAVPG